MKITTAQLDKIKTAVKTLEDAGYTVQQVENATSYNLKDEDTTGETQLEFELHVTHVEDKETMEI